MDIWAVFWTNKDWVMNELCFERTEWWKESTDEQSTNLSITSEEKELIYIIRSEIHTIVTNDHETHFDVNKKKIGRSVWQELSFEVGTLKMQNWKQNYTILALILLFQLMFSRFS